MTYDNFWHDDVNMVRAYRKANEMNRRRQNEALWVQGMYIREALASTVGNMFSKTSKFEYPAEPYPITEAQVEEKREKDRKVVEDRIKADLFAMAERMRKTMPVEAHPNSEGGETNE